MSLKKKKKDLQAFIPWKYTGDWNVRHMKLQETAFPLADTYRHILLWNVRQFSFLQGHALSVQNTENSRCKEEVFCGICFGSFSYSPMTFSRSPRYILSYTIHNESSLVSSFGWYPSSVTLPGLSGLSSSQLVDRRPKFITTFHCPPLAYLIYDSINNNRCRMPRRPLCPAHFPGPVQITSSHSQPIKTVFTYQRLWGCHSVFKTDAQREVEEWPSHRLQCCKSRFPNDLSSLLVPKLYWEPSLCLHNKTFTL